MSSSAPYWGQLPGPKVSAQTKPRRQSDDYSLGERLVSRHASGGSSAKPNRISVQTNYTDAPTESTLSPYASPTTPSFAGTGLAPRPPSFPYGTSQYPPELLEKRERRRSRRSEEHEELSGALPPAAPDVPRAPPVSYRHPHGNGGLPFTFPATGPARPSRQTGPLPDDMEAEEFYKEPTPDRPHRDLPVLDRTQQSLDSRIPRMARAPEGDTGRRASTGGRERDKAREPGGDVPGARKASTASQPAAHSKVLADDRSPLQRLELTLDSITKEEKRARVEAAEQRARDQSTQTTTERSSGQQVRFRDKRPSVAVEEGRPVDVVASGRPREIDAHRGPLSQNPPEEGRSYGSRSGPRTQAAELKQSQGSKSGVPQRNLSFRERAVKDNLKLPNGMDSPPIASPPDGGGMSLTRSGSNKLRKEPPGDPWFSRRAEAEKQYQIFGKRNEGVAAAGLGAATIPRSMAGSAKEKALPPLPVAPAASAAPAPSETRRPAVGGKAAAFFGNDEFVGAKRRATDPVAPKRRSIAEEDMDEYHAALVDGSRRIGAVRAAEPAADVAIRSPQRPPRPDRDGSDDGWSDNEHKRHVSDKLFHARDSLEPGKGMYNPPKFLDEWKKGTVGTLSGALLDLSEDHPPGAEKDKTWWESGGRRRGSYSSRPRRAEAFDGEYDEMHATRFKPPLYLKCGPLLRYCGLRREKIPTRSVKHGAVSERHIWRGSVMIVTRDNDSSYDIAPTLRLFVQPLELLPPPPAELHGEEKLSPEYVDPIAGHPKLGRRGETLYVRPVEHLEEARDLSWDETDSGLFEKTRSPPDVPVEGGRDLPGSYAGRRKRVDIDGEKVSKYKDVRGFRLHTERHYTFWRFNIEVELREKQQRIAYRINRGPSMGFWVPARGHAMNIMFYSCNGFSKNVRPDALSGPDPMWRDVLNTHQSRPFHVMIGGGDQIYNDIVSEQSEHFQEWLLVRNPLQKHNMPFTPQMQDELEGFYLEHYCAWFSQGLFGLANSQIPMVNMFDDHDVFDGYGSYPHHDMNSPVFCGLGSVAFKYYMLFQHQSVLDETEASEPSWVLGESPGPYISAVSRSLFMFLGSKVALVAVDARTERTEFDVLRNDTWQRILDRLYAEITKGKAEHLLVLLGVPVAYPRLVWLENILTSRLLDPVKALGRIGMLGNTLNHIDNGVEVLDDLNDHWTSRNHKNERRVIIEDLQDFAAERSVRVTILSGDVHLAAIGQFYSNPKLGLPKHKDFRYMPNIISSAIANAPPGDLLADVLNKRNKVHHFDRDTDESMIPIFNHGVDGKPRNNKHLLPHRNWCSIREWTPGHTPPPTPPLSMYDRSPSPPGSRGGGLFRRLSRNRGPSNRVDAPKEKPQDSRPPNASRSGGLFRSISRRLSSDSERPPTSEQPPKPARTLSLTRIFRRRPSQQPNDGGINGNWGDDSGGEDDPRDPRAASSRSHDMRLRGGGDQDEYEEGDESYFSARPNHQQQYQHQHHQHHYRQPPPADDDPATSPRGRDEAPPQPAIKPFHRTPTGLTAKQHQRADEHAVDVEGGLDVSLNVEVNAQDPAGITVPYRLLVPRLFYEYEGEDATAEPRESRFQRLLSFRRKQRASYLPPSEGVEEGEQQQQPPPPGETEQ